jgi:biopolymer transport protein ExbD
MVDVMFFLVVTFMLASLSMQSLNSVPVNLPQGRTQTLAHSTPVTLTVTRDSQLFLNKTPTTLATLAATLKLMFHEPGHSMVVAADDAAPEGVVVRAMIEARHAGIQHFMIAVKRRE